MVERPSCSWSQRQVIENSKADPIDWNNVTPACIGLVCRRVFDGEFNPSGGRGGWQPFFLYIALVRREQSKREMVDAENKARVGVSNSAFGGVR